MSRPAQNGIGLATAAAGGCVCVAFGAAAGYAWHGSRTSPLSDVRETVVRETDARETDVRWTDVRVTDLLIYPVKGCGPIRVSRARVTPRGLEGDRLFMVVDFVGRMQTQRQIPAMATIRTAFDEVGNLVLSAPGWQNFVLSKKDFEAGERKKVTVWQHVCEDAIDQGDKAGSFFSKALDVSGLRLVRMPDELVRPVQPGKPNRLEEPALHKTSFSDKYPFLLTNESSLELVGEKSGVPELSMLRFRPNIVVGGPRLDAFGEHEWTRIRVGSANHFDVAEQCTRCQVPRIDPSTGIPRTDNEPTATLKKMTNNCFGQNLCAADFGGIVSIGDTLTVEASDENAPLK